MPPFMKDELKKKEEQRLDEMQREIDEATSSENQNENEVANDTADNNEPPTDTGFYAETADDDAATVSFSAEGQFAAEAQRLSAKLQETESSLKRLRADFENYRRRTAKEKEELSDFVAQGILKDLLPLLDNFERAMAAEQTDAMAFQKGIEMIFTQFAEILKKNGLTQIDTTNVQFDPNFHQAVMRVENPELEDGTIVAELQKGYMAKGRVIRPAMVQVVGNG